MSEDHWIRARSSEQIEQRMHTILDAAGKVFHTVPYEKVTMQMIANETGFSRSNLYRYFTTREEIFLALFLSDIETWAIRIKSVFTHEETPETFIEKWTEVLCGQKRLLELVPLLSISLEKNTSEEVYRKTKLLLMDYMKEIIPFLQKAIPSLGFEQWREFLLVHLAFHAGAWPMAQYNDLQTKILEELCLDEIKIEFSSFYRKSMLTYLKGVCGDLK
jgi:TetR/AcrR family transcriptional regulator